MRGILLLLLTISIVSISACGQVADLKKKVGLTIESPDEFLVQPQKPLQMPETKNLPVPQPGAKSLVAYDPEAEARKALFGNSTSISTTPSVGEADLLKSANAANVDPNIRSVVEEEAGDSGGQVYLLDSLFGKPSKNNGADILDPEAEAKRIKHQTNTGTTE